MGFGLIMEYYSVADLNAACAIPPPMRLVAPQHIDCIFF